MGPRRMIRNRDELFRAFERKHYFKGQLIFDQERPAGEAYLVESGLVEIFVPTGAGEKVLTRVGENGLFGEAALVGGGARTASARAAKDTICRIIRADEFERRFNENERFRKGVIRLLVDSIRRTTEQVAGALEEVERRQAMLDAYRAQIKVLQEELEAQEQQRAERPARTAES